MPTAASEAFQKLPYPSVVIIGGGFAGLRLVRELEGRPFKVTLLDRHNHHCFQPLLYQVATASLSADSIAHPFRRTIAPMPNVGFRMCEVTSIDPARNLVHTDHGIVHYDLLIIATGSTTNFFGNKQVEEQAMQLKSIDQALDIRSDFLQDFEAALYLQDEASQRQRLNFVIVGGGPTGVELAGAMAEIRQTVLKNEYRELESDRMMIHLIDSGDRVLKTFSEANSARALKYLKEMGVNVLLGKRVASFDGDVLTFVDGGTMPSNTVIWAAGVKGRTIPGLESALDARSSRYRVDAFNQVEGLPNVFAVGDIAQMTADPIWPQGHPQVAPAAIQQAELLARNLLVKDRSKWKAYRYVDKGSMAVIGRGKAVFDRKGIHFGGVVAWLGWLFIHVMQLVGFRNRMQVLFNWAWKYLSWKNTIRLIIRPYVRRASSVEVPQP